MPKIKSTKASISDQLLELQNTIHFLETTSDIDTAITQYESAMKTAATLVSELENRKQKITTITQKYAISTEAIDDDTH